MQIVRANEEMIPAIAEIYNHAVATTTALWSEEEVSVENRMSWFHERIAGDFPVFAAQLPDGTVVGYASYGPFRPFPGYRHTVENSVYVREGFHGRGIGKALMTALVEHASERGLWAMVAAIESTNETSIALHQGVGFEVVAQMPAVGEKWGRPLDLTLMQLNLPASPARS